MCVYNKSVIEPIWHTYRSCTAVTLPQNLSGGNSSMLYCTVFLCIGHIHREVLLFNRGKLSSKQQIRYQKIWEEKLSLVLSVCLRVNELPILISRKGDKWEVLQAGELEIQSQNAGVCTLHRKKYFIPG